MNDTTNPLFDENFAKEQTLHNESLLIELLEQFLLDNQNVSDDISNKAQEGPEALHFVLHRLKGVSSNLGCMRLFKRLQTHCHTLSKGLNLDLDDIHQVNALVAETFQAVAAYVQRHHGNNSANALSSNATDALAILRQLKQDLEENAFISSQELNQISTMTNDESINALMEQLISAVEHLEYDDAISITDQLLVLLR